jgi:tetratricopeptide (TPR) repeat protein
VKPNYLCALWAKAEVLRRNYKFKESKVLLKQVLSQSPGHIPSLITLCYIDYHENDFNKAANILKGLLKRSDLDRENKAFAYMLIGSINAKKASSGGLLSKFVYGTDIKEFFEKAKAIAPDLPEVRLGLGSFYLFAPKIFGGNIDKAIIELESAVKLAPDFATANARLAQAYKNKGILEKYDFYIKRAKELNPHNEALMEAEK